MKSSEGKGIKLDLQGLFKLWKKYKQDPKVLYDPNPPLGIVFTFEGFWYWLIKKYDKKTK